MMDSIELMMFRVLIAISIVVSVTITIVCPADTETAVNVYTVPALLEVVPKTISLPVQAVQMDISWTEAVVSDV